MKIKFKLQAYDLLLQQLQVSIHRDGLWHHITNVSNWLINKEITTTI